jgi:hypothetical protein
MRNILIALLMLIFICWLASCTQPTSLAKQENLKKCKCTCDWCTDEKAGRHKFVNGNWGR